jgi:hypothetical protein
MMDLPKCRTCGERHGLGGCPSNAGPAKKSRDGMSSHAGKESGASRNSVELPSPKSVARQELPVDPALVTQPKARSSAVEPSAHNGLVAGSNPAAPTKPKRTPHKPKVAKKVTVKKTKPTLKKKTAYVSKRERRKRVVVKPSDLAVPAAAVVKIGPATTENKGNTLSALKPWAAAGISRAAWYRLRKQRIANVES